MFGSIFTLKGVKDFTSKESLEEEANNFILANRDELFVKTVHADWTAANAAHEILRKKFGKTGKAALTEFMTNQVNIDKDKIKKIVGERNGKAFLNLNTVGKADVQHGPFYVLFTTNAFIFFCKQYWTSKDVKSVASSYPMPAYTWCDFLTWIILRENTSTTRMVCGLPMSTLSSAVSNLRPPELQLCLSLVTIRLL